MRQIFSAQALRHILFGLVVLLINSGSIHAQTLFQNNNATCQSVTVLCDSGTPSCSSDARSVACKNIASSVDFNGDGFVDCVATSIAANNTLDQIASVLLNTTNPAVSCAGGAGDQFNTALDYSIDFLEFVGPLSSVVAGNINGADFDDFALAEVGFADIPDNQLVSAYSLPGGGFGADGSAIPMGQSDSVLWELLNGQTGYQANEAEKNMVLFDCDGDGDLDNVIANEFTTAFGMGIAISGLLTVNRNDGSGFVAINDGVLPGDNMATAGFLSTMGGGLAQSVAVADFDGINGPDVVSAVNPNIPAAGGASNPGIWYCANEGACGFPDSCTQVVDLTAQSPQAGQSFDPFSIVAGDFNGDGFQDVAVSGQTPGLLAAPFKGVVYFFGNGDGTFQTPGTSVAYVGGASDASIRALTSGCFNNDNVIDVAFLNNAPGTGGTGDVRVITSDGVGGLNPPLILNYDDGLVLDGDGIDAADFDNQGGDDIIALANQFSTGNRTAYVFLNTVEQIIAEAGPYQAVTLNQATAITGASCSVNPDDPADPATFAFNWTISPAAGATLTDTDRLDPTITVTTEGTYTLTLECRTRCDEVATDTKVITVGDVPPPPPPPIPPGTSTQGGNFFCSMGSNGGATGAGAGVALLILGLGALLALRFRRGVILGLIALCLLTGGLQPAQALTNSVSVNTFTPTVDDSDFITVYGSETMLKRNFHVGFFLDYAYRPYEFGNANFDRVSGIVDHLLDANIVGSYGVLDWFTVGVAIPVHLYESLNAPLLGINESNFALGDVELYFKFRVLDREKHGVGIAVIPFARFPTSTNSTDFLGDGSFGGGGIIVIDGKIGERVSLALNLGYNVRGKFIDLGGNEINDEFLASLGLSVAVIKNVFHIIGEFQTATVVNNFYSSQRTTPLEGRVGFRYTWANNHDINAGVGLGVLHGIGQPAIRGFVGYTYTKRPLAEVTVPPPPMNEIQVGDELTLKDKIYFDFDKWSIRDISKPTLDKIAGFLKAHPEVTKIKIDGYTCDLGTNSYNDRLSQRRANSVKNYLEAQGISPERIGTVQGYGEANPLVPNTDEANREQNRRVQIFVEAVNNAQ